MHALGGSLNTQNWLCLWSCPSIPRAHLPQYQSMTLLDIFCKKWVKLEVLLEIAAAADVSLLTE